MKPVSVNKEVSLTVPIRSYIFWLPPLNTCGFVSNSVCHRRLSGPVAPPVTSATTRHIEDLEIEYTRLLVVADHDQYPIHYLLGRKTKLSG